MSRAVIETLESRQLLAASIEVGPKLIRFNDPRGGAATVGTRIAIRNNGDTPLTINEGQITLVGDNPGQFALSLPAGQINIAPNTSQGIYVTFDPSSGTAVGSIQAAHLRIRSNDPEQPIFKGVSLRGLVTAGTDGANEPSLQRILDLYELPIDVGDDDPSTSVLNDPPVYRPTEIWGQRFTKAGAGAVTIEVLSTFGVASRPAVKFGYYDPGTPGIGRSKDLFDVPNTQAQTVQVTPQGSTAFDPGADPFAFYATFPAFRNSDGLARTVYSEDWLNTWEPTNRFKHKVRVYPLKVGNGRVVPNAFVLAVEEVPGSQPDNQDLVAIVRNIRPAASGPEFGFETPNGAPFPGRMVFNEIGDKNDEIPNRVLRSGTLRIRNTGNRTLTINNLIPSGPFTIVGTPPTSVAPGDSADVTIRFTATGGSIHLASLKIDTNDPDEPRTVIALAGNWQTQSEGAREPDLERLFRLYGFGTVIRYSGQQLNQGGASGVTVGDEVLSPYWREADPSMPVAVRQLNAFHTQGDKASLYWHAKGSNTVSRILQHAEPDGQTFFPRLDGTSRPATGTFNPSTGTVFGFRVDANEWSDDTKNEFGHQVRFFPLRDAAGNFVPNAFIMIMDYDGINYDYNDNVYLIENIRPENDPTTPVGFNATVRGNGVALDWADSPDAGFDHFVVQRSTTSLAGFTTISGELAGSSFVDTDVTAGTTYYYRVRTIIDDTASVPASTNIRFA